MTWTTTDPKGNWHAGGIAYGLDSEKLPLKYWEWKDLEPEGFRVVAWGAFCVCGWICAPLPRTLPDGPDGSLQQASPTGEVPEWVKGFFEGAWLAHTTGIDQTKYQMGEQ